VRVVVLNRVQPRNWALAAAAAFCIGMAISVVIVGYAPGSARGAGSQFGQGSSPTIYFASPGVSAYGVDDGAFYSDGSLFVPLALTDVEDRRMKSLGIDPGKARHAAVVIDALNTALAQAGFRTYRSYAAAVNAGAIAPHAAVEAAYPSAAALSVTDCVNLRRALDHLALTGDSQAAREWLRTGQRPEHWRSAADAPAAAEDAL